MTNTPTPENTPSESKRSWLRLRRDVIMFMLGAGGFLHELLTKGAERPFLLTLCGALMGLPFVLGLDRKNGKDQ